MLRITRVIRRHHVQIPPSHAAQAQGGDAMMSLIESFDALAAEIRALRARLATAEAELQEHRRVAGELDVLLGSGCDAAQPELVEQLQQRLATAEATVLRSVDDLSAALTTTEEARDRWHQKYVVEAQARQDEGKVLADGITALRARHAEHMEGAYREGYFDGHGDGANGFVRDTVTAWMRSEAAKGVAP